MVVARRTDGVVHPKQRLISAEGRTGCSFKTPFGRILRTVTPEITSKNFMHSSMTTLKSFRVFLKALKIASVVRY
jgi:hypothetical protein